MTGTRLTRQRVAVLDALVGSDQFTSAQDIHGRLRAAGDKVGLTTVYRHLQALADAGEIDVLRDAADGEARYRRCETRAHHHHLVCRGCGRTDEVAAAPVERWATRVATAAGFSDITHTVEVFGTCARCTRRR